MKAAAMTSWWADGGWSYRLLLHVSIWGIVPLCECSSIHFSDQLGLNEVFNTIRSCWNVMIDNWTLFAVGWASIDATQLLLHSLWLQTLSLIAGIFWLHFCTVEESGNTNEVNISPLNMSPSVGACWFYVAPSGGPGLHILLLLLWLTFTFVTIFL